MPVTSNKTPYVDAGTGTHTAAAPVAVGDLDAPVTDLGTGAYPGPSEPEVYVSEDHEGAPTGAGVGPSEPETRYEWPMQADGTLAPSAATSQEQEETTAAPAKRTPAKKVGRSRKR